MAKFVFNLDPVLRHRVHVEQERTRDLAVAQAEMTRLQAELKALNDALRADAQDMKSNHLTGPIDVNYLAAHRRYTVATQRKGMQLVQEMAKQQRKVDEAQKLLADAAKERKVLEKLRERQRERWAQEVQRKELAELDEVGMQLSYRQLKDEDLETELTAESAGAAGTSLAVSRPGALCSAKPQATSDAARRSECDRDPEERRR